VDASGKVEFRRMRAVRPRKKSQRRDMTRRDMARRALLRIDGRSVEVTLQLNRRARRLIVKVHPSTGEVTVVAPSRRAFSEALDFARTESDWIARRLKGVPRPVLFELGARIPLRGETHIIRRGETRNRPVWVDRSEDEPIIRVSGWGEHTGRRVFDFLKREARKSLEQHALYYAGMIGTRYKRITVRDTATRWGSCSSGRVLSFSWRLIMAPPYVLDYVVAHEVAHLREMNHGPRFWRLVENMVDNAERAQRWLAQNGTALHRYAPRGVE
jgi:predicted metal-dependent hydrolase